MPSELPGSAALEGVDLATVLAAAALQRRVDRKYLVALTDVPRLLERLGESHRVLEVHGRRTSQYRSTYLDTAELRACRDHLQGRRLRWKARSRLYVEDDLCRFEVKVRDGRGETVKHAVDVPVSRYGVLGEVEQAFLTDVLGRAVPVSPVLEVGYTRATLVDLAAGTRTTLDRGIAGATLRRDGAPLRPGRVVFADDLVVVETKGGTRPSTADRALRSMGYRESSLSKYATSAALLSDVPDNAVRHLVGSHVRLETPAPVLTERCAS